MRGFVGEAEQRLSHRAGVINGEFELIVTDFFLVVLSTKLASQRSWRIVRADVVNLDRIAML
jgi:hypothetical protein